MSPFLILAILTVVYDAKIRIIKQITTVPLISLTLSALLFMMQRYE